MSVTETDEFAAYPPGLIGGAAAVVRDLAIGSLLGAGFIGAVGLTLGLAEEIAGFDIAPLGMVNEARVVVGVVAVVMLAAGIIWPIANRAEQLGVIRSMRRGATHSPHLVPPRYQRTLLHATKPNKVIYQLGVVLLAFFGLLAVLCFFVMFFENDGGVGTIMFLASALVAGIGYVLVRFNGSASAANLRKKELSARAAEAWHAGRIARAENNATRRARNLKTVALPEYRVLEIVGNVVGWPGRTLMFIGLFVLTAWQPNDDLRRVMEPPKFLQDTLHIWAAVFTIGLVLTVVSSGITGTVLVLRSADLRRMLRDVEFRHERPPLDELGIALGDDPASRRWARTLIGMALPVAFLTYLVIHAARLDLPAIAASAVAGGVFLGLGLAGSVLSVGMQTTLATKMLAAFGVRDKETRRTVTVLDEDE